MCGGPDPLQGPPGVKAAVHLCSRRLLPRRVHAHGEAKMLTQPGFSYPYRAARMLAVGGCCGCKQGSPGDGGWGGRTTPQCTGSYPAAGSLGPIAALPCHARKGNWRGARVDENWGGKWSLEEELGIPRVLRSHPNWKEPVQSGTSDARDQPKRAPPLPPAPPQAFSLAPQILRARADPGAALGEGVQGRTRSPRARSRSLSHCS